jgi:fibronectin type 3 domain-containing protein
VTLAAPVDTTAPGIPTGFVMDSVTATSATISWQAPSDNSGVIDHYNIYRTHSGSNYNNVPYTTSLSTTFVDYGLVAGQTLKYCVTAVDAGGNESGRTSDLYVTPN